MTALSLVTIFCDGPDCVFWAAMEDTAKEARAQLVGSSWITALPGGKDYCSAECRRKDEEQR